MQSRQEGVGILHSVNGTISWTEELSQKYADVSANVSQIIPPCTF